MKVTRRRFSGGLAAGWAAAAVAPGLTSGVLVSASEAAASPWNSSPPTSEDPFLWLEEIDGPQARTWVAARNAETVAALRDPQFEADRASMLATLNAPDRIPGIVRHGSLIYNFWRDAAHPRGLLRRTTLRSYRTDSPEWETIIDVDALARREQENWVWRGMAMLAPARRRAIVTLSRGGADASVLREFDLVERQFLPDGFYLPEAKGGASWVDQDTLLVSSALGDASMRTTSGYARTIRLWRRGTPFAEADVIFTGAPNDMSVGASFQRKEGRTLLVRKLDFFTQHYFFSENSGPFWRIAVPDDAYLSVRRDTLFVMPRTDWTPGTERFPAGSLLAIDFAEFMRGDRGFAVLFRPTPTRFLQSFATAGGTIAILSLDTVRSRITLTRRTEEGWISEPMPELPGMPTLGVGTLGADPDEIGAAEQPLFILSAHSPIMPTSLFLLNAKGQTELLKQAPARFDARGLAVTQHEAVSVDGARIPYFLVGRSDLPRDGSNAVLMSGYGGFGISSLPSYSAEIGKLWLERGGVYIISNIRGGGEFGPAWHKAGMRAGKKLAHDDFAAVARDLISSGLTRPDRLACRGGSNGGLLVGNMLTRYPELFGAILCYVPLLDMKRYTKLLAGASWIGEYGDPDKPEDWAFLKDLSAYQNVDPSRPYPPMFLLTSARDDRVHPGHARKMAAKLREHGRQVHFYEPQAGGHAGAADNIQVAFNAALGFAFLRKTVAPEMTIRANT